jgi:hypothetical protein
MVSLCLFPVACIVAHPILLKSVQEGSSLPIELIVIIGEFLAGSHALKSLASLNVASREVHVEVLPILYETLVWVRYVTWLLAS